MIDLSAFMWALAAFFALIGYLRGWDRELVVTAAIVLTSFMLLQFDALFRTIFPGITPGQLFFVQIAIFFVIVFIVYNARDLAINVGRRNMQSGLLGVVVGALNGYLIGGALWYFLDINEYPLDQFIIAPAANSPSAAAIDWIPMVILGGGTSGSADIMSFVVLILLFFVLSSI
jgi:uncharacterized membrane protein required for colicin V production